MVNLTHRDIWYAVGLAAIFVGGYLGASAINHFLIGPIRRRRHLQRRLLESQRDEEARAKIFKPSLDRKRGPITAVLEKIGCRDLIKNLQLQLRQADIECNVRVFLSVVGMLILLGLIVGINQDTLLGGAGLALILGSVPFLTIRVKKNRKALLVEKQMPDAMELLARSLRAGHTLSSAIELAGQEIPHPLGTELRITFEEQRLGVSMAEALRHMVDRIDSKDLRYFVTAVLVQAETGGNLAEIVEKIGYLIRDRLRVKGKIRTLTAEGRLSAIVLSGMPFLLFFILYVIRKNYVMLLFDAPLGRKMVVAAIISICFGVLVMRRIIQIRV